jgi:PHD/YefM family antitoxin component YafN of YafNO toxin-antitoxin module
MSGDRELAGIIERVACQDERVRIYRQGELIAVVLPPEDLAVLEELEDQLEILEAEHMMAICNGTVLLEDVKAEPLE